MDTARRLVAEAIGTFMIVLGGCGAAVLTAKFWPGQEAPFTGIGILGVAIAFGLTVLIMVYAVGHISGGHFNPAVTVGLWAGKRFPGRDVLPYVVVQVVGAIVAALVVLLIAKGQPAATTPASRGSPRTATGATRPAATTSPRRCSPRS